VVAVKRSTEDESWEREEEEEEKRRGWEKTIDGRSGRGNLFDRWEMKEKP